MRNSKACNFPKNKIMDYPESPFEGQENPLSLRKLKHIEANDIVLSLQEQHQLEDAHVMNVESALAIEELSIERDCFKSKIFEIEARVREREEELLRRVYDGMREKVCFEVEIYEGMREREELVRKINEGTREKERLSKELEAFKERNEKLEEKLTMGLGLLGSIKESLMWVNEMDQDHVCGGTKKEMSSSKGKSKEWEGMREFSEELGFVAKMAKRVSKKLSIYPDREELLGQLEAHKRRNEELQLTLSSGLVALDSMKVSLLRACEALNEKEVEFGVDHEWEEVNKEVLSIEEKSQEPKDVKAFASKFDFLLKMAKRVEKKLNCYHEKVLKENRELENSVLSLTEENRDVTTLLRIALVEKEAVEKKLKGNTEQKSHALLQLFGFMMGGGAANEQSEVQKKDNEQISENMASNTSRASDISSEREEEVVSLASTVEKMMKSLRLEISQLRRALAESRSDTERLQILVEKQAQQITEQKACIKELEDEERVISEKVEQLLIEMKATDEDVERWREACEFEVDAGKRVVEERDKVIEILKQELEKTRAALKASNRKLKLKEELAVAAMAAQSAAEKSIQLADSRAAGLHRRIEELTKRLEEAESSEKNHRHKTRHTCCSWLALRFVNPANANRTGARNVDIRSVLPEMQALLHYNV